MYVSSMIFSFPAMVPFAVFERAFTRAYSFSSRSRSPVCSRMFPSAARFATSLACTCLLFSSASFLLFVWASLFCSSFSLSISGSFESCSSRLLMVAFNCPSLLSES